MVGCGFSGGFDCCVHYRGCDTVRYFQYPCGAYYEANPDADVELRKRMNMTEN